MMGQFFVAIPSLGLVAGGVVVKGWPVKTNGFSLPLLRFIGFAPSALHVHHQGLSTWALWLLRSDVAAGTPARHNPPRHSL
jgi:hypothetical protein